MSSPPTIGPFELTERVSSQVLSELWRAEHRATGRPAAVKFVRPPEQRASLFRTRFAHEVRAVASLDHPRVVRLYDHGELDATDAAEALWLPPGTPYLVMAWLDGTDLEIEPPRDWPEVRRVLLAVLDALAHAHARGVVHCDIKPANIVASSAGPILTDFGLALLDGPLEIVDDSTLVGTPAYMAPEQIRGDLHRMGPWTDLYSLGCTAYGWLSGRRVFDGDGLLEVLDMHLEAPPPPLAAVMDVPAGVQGWLERLLAKRPADRFRFAADAALALGRLGGGEVYPSISLPAPDAPPWSKGPDRRGRPPMPPLSRPRRTGPLFPLTDTGHGLFALRRARPVGRQPQRELLWRALRRVRDEERARVVLIEGPAGMGKSHLVRWLGSRAHSLGLARSLLASHAAAPTPTCGVGPMVARALRCAGRTPDEQQAILTDLLGSYDALDGLVAALAPSGRFDRRDRPIALSSPDERYAALAGALATLARERPLVVGLDDAHWGEDAQRFALYVLRRHPRLPVLLVATARSDLLTPGSAPSGLWQQLVERPKSAHITIGPLSPMEQADHVQALVALEPKAMRRLLARTAGSPQLAEETVRLWLARGLLRNGPQGVELRASIVDESAPTTPAHEDIWLSRVEGALGGREPRAAEAFELAAAMGQTVVQSEWEAACSVAGLPIPTLAVAQMHAERLIEADGTTHWRFVSADLVDALRQRATRRGRWSAWHRYCALALLQGASADPDRLARHQLGSRQYGAAIDTLVAAFEWATGRGDQAAARNALIERARALRALNAEADDPRWVYNRILRARLARLFGQIEVARRWASRAVLQARALGSATLTAEALIESGVALRLTEGDTSGWPNLEEAIALALESDSSALEARARFVGAACLNLMGRAREAEEQLDHALIAAEIAEVPRLEGDVLVGLADLARRRGDLSTTRAMASEAYERYVSAGHRIGRAMVCSLQGDLARYRGELDNAARHYEESRRLYAAVDSPDLPIAETNLALVELARGDASAARRRLENALEMAWLGHELRVLIHGLLLPCVAAEADWTAWDHHFAALGPLRDGRLAEPDVADAAREAARLADAAGQRERATDARELAVNLYLTLDRKDDASAVRAEARRAVRLSD